MLVPAVLFLTDCLIKVLLIWDSNFPTYHFVKILLVSSRVTGVVASNQRSKGWRSRHRCEFVRTVTTTCSMREAWRTPAETELHLYSPQTEETPPAEDSDLRSISFLHLPCCSLSTSPHNPKLSPLKTSLSLHTSHNHMYSNTLRDGKEGGCEGGRKKREWQITKKLSHHFYHLHLPPGGKKINKQAKTPSLRHTSINQPPFFLWDQEQGKLLPLHRET